MYKRTMRTWLIAIVVLVACECEEPQEESLFLDHLEEMEAEEDAPLPDGVVVANNRFAVALYSQLRETEGNLVISPVSIASALSLAYAGARGRTADEMAGVLELGDLEPDEVHSGYQNQFAAWNDDRNEYQLRVANRIFASASLQLDPAYADLSRQHYGAAPEQLDFANEPEVSRQRINGWVEENTERRIRELLAPGTIQPSTQVVLTNAVYFKSEWRSPFEEEDTSLQPFFAPAGELSVPTMVQEEEYRRYTGEGVEMVRLRYMGDFEMVLLIPDQRDGLARLEEGLSVERVANWIENSRLRNTQLFLPKFKYEPSGSIALRPALERLGMREPFGSSADFSGMASDPIALSDVVHKTFVEVNEEGTEAAAATGSVGIMGAGPGAPQELRVDRPFLFLIRDSRTGGWLFVGRIVNPS